MVQSRLSIDEFSMLRQKELFYIDQILRQIGDPNKEFGGFAVLLVGHPAQIPAVQGRVVWDASVGGGHDDFCGHVKYSLFENVIELTDVRRVDGSDNEAATFLDLLERLRDGQNTAADWELTRKKCSQSSMHPDEWNARFDETSNDVTYLFNSNKEVNEYNNKRLVQLGNPIALVEARHTGRSKAMASSIFRGLQAFLFLSVFARVVLSSNVCQPAGLCNGAVGTVVDIIYKDGDTAPSLPSFVLVDFGNSYTGPPFFSDTQPERRGWVPICCPMVVQEWTKPNVTSGAGCEEHSRTMLPLRLAWAWTTWKAQGQTFLERWWSSSEKEHGLTYTAFSRVTKFSNLGIIGGFTMERFTTKIGNHAKVAPRMREESRLRELARLTVARLQEIGNR